MLKPIKCSICPERFPDLSSIDKHVLISHTNSRITTLNALMPKRMTLAEMRNKLQLQKRLDGLVVAEILKNTLNQCAT